MGHPTTRLAWDGRSATGEALCDGEHQVMVMLFNDFSRAMESRASATCAAARFDTLASHIRGHLAREDRLIAHRGLDEPPQRARARRDLRRIADAVEAGLHNADDRRHAASLLRDWIADHVADDLALFAGTAARDAGSSDPPATMVA